MYNDYGWLTVRTETAGAYPVVRALVRIRGAEEENKEVVYSLFTDRDGLTERIRLPAPALALSMSPGQNEIPYATYDLEITADGYYPKRIYGINVFPKTDAIQVVSMIPASNGSDEPPIGDLNIEIPSYYTEK